MPHIHTSSAPQVPEFQHAGTCVVCPRRCDLRAQAAFCGGYALEADTLINLAWGQVASWSVDAIEKKPVYHYRPGSYVLSLGSWGCTFRCRYCLNHELAWRRSPDAPFDTQVRWSPDDAVRRALRNGCQGIAWTFNEAAVWLPYVVATNRAARAAGLYTVLVTNGAYTDEALDRLLPTLDVWRVDLKAWDDAFHRSQLGVPFGAGIAREATLRARRAGVHVEVVTCLTPVDHGRWEALAPLGTWIRDALGSDTPWHLLKFHPQHLMRDVAPFADNVARHHQRQALELGLRHVHVGGDGLDDPLDRQLAHYEWRGPQGEFLRISIDYTTGAIGYVGDRDLLEAVLERCQAAGLTLAMASESLCG